MNEKKYFSHSPFTMPLIPTEWGPRVPHSPFPTVMCKRWFCGLGIAIFNTIFFGANCARAQIPTPDMTLPNNSIVTQNGSTFNITGGTQAGGNLFHSFNSFSVPTGSEAFFHNGVDIQNIITRVTGGSISNIDGIIHTLFTANLFLINPNGIMFGPNASLNVGGSFIGSTAKSINFADGTIFSSTPTEPTALLTVSVPLGLQFGSNPGEIIVRGPGYDFPYDGNVTQETRPKIETSVPGLAVNPRQTLALVGGKVSVEGGVLSSPTGRIEIGSVDSLQSVNLVPVQHDWKLRYPEASSFGDIQISDKSFVSTTGVGGGSIAIVGKNINLKGQSILVGDTLGDRDGGTTRISGENIVVDQSLISSNTYGSGSGGQIQLDANNITLNNTAVVVQTQGTGNGGTINVVGKNSLQIDGGGSLASSAQGNSTGNAGDVNVNVTGPIEARNAGITAYTSLGAGGNAGNINITGNSLVLENAQVSADTTNTGKGGDINIHVADFLNVDSAGITTDSSGTGDGGKINITANSFQVKGVGISSNASSTGKAGEINIDAGSIEVGLGVGGGINTNSSGKGEAGTINIKANSFVLKGGAVTSNTEENSTGKAGDITVNVAGPLTIDTAGITTNTAGTGNAGNINITANSLQVASAGINSRTSENSIGNAGDVIVNVPGQLRIDDATISTNAEGIGNAGKITITTEFLKLDNALNDPSISATSTSGKGGDIDLEIGNLLLLRHQGSGAISTTAGNAGTGGDGGNITINAPKGFIVAIPSENSDITANAFTGNGGIITINASGLYGISPRPQLTPLSDITAFSQRGISGKISINRPDVDQHLELSKLPKVFADMSLLNASCSALANTFSDIDSNPKKSKFIITGRGGLPPNPYDPLSGDVVWSDTRLPNISEQQQRREKPKAKPPSQGKVVEINPATGWVFNGNGDVTLISQKYMSNGLQSTPTTCPQQ